LRDPEEMPVNMPVAVFQVPAGAATVYIGLLTLELSTTPRTKNHPRDWELDDIRVTDDLALAVAALRARYPGTTEPVVRHLMITDDALPGLFADYSQKRCAAILARHGWQLRKP
jgi:hypothetical protein